MSSPKFQTIPISTFLTFQRGGEFGRYYGLNFQGTQFVLEDQGKILGVDLDINDPPILSTTFDLLSGTQDNVTDTFQKEGSLVIDMANYPAVVGSLIRVVKFKATIENARDTTDYEVEVQLYDLTHSVVITGSLLDNSAAADRTIPTEVSATLTVGSSAGDVRDDAPTMYAAQFRMNGTFLNSDAAILSSAYLEISYV